MPLTRFIRYEIDPFKRALLQRCCEEWGRIIARRGGHLIGYFLPSRGTHYEAGGLISFDSLAAYEACRTRPTGDCLRASEYSGATIA